MNNTRKLVNYLMDIYLIQIYLFPIPIDLCFDYLITKTTLPNACVRMKIRRYPVYQKVT